MSTPQPEASEPETARSDEAPRASEQKLIASARRWVDEALSAWLEEDYEKVALVAPVAVEHLGKAALWRTSPVLVMEINSEPSLLALVQRPDLSRPGVKTVTLRPLLSRLDKVIKDCPVPEIRRNRMADARNGAAHAGGATDVLNVLLDCLSVTQWLLAHLSIEPGSYFGGHVELVSSLADRERAVVSRQVATKRLRARGRLAKLEETLGRTVFESTAIALEGERLLLDSQQFVSGGTSADARCPECDSIGRLIGFPDAATEMEWDVEPLGGGSYAHIPMPYLVAVLSPRAFVCSVCSLALQGQDELAEAGLQSSTFELDEAELDEPGFVLADFMRNKLYDD